MFLSKVLPLAIAASLSAGAAVAADDWPNKPIKLIIPFAPGGATDIVGRLAAEGLAAELGQPVVPENRAGAGGAIGAAAVAKSPADGYTIGVATVSTQVVNPVLMKLSYRPDKDLISIVQIAAVPNVLEVHPSVPAQNMKEFISLLKANPTKYNFASAGAGGVNHIACEIFLSVTGTKMTHVPYKGAGAAMGDLLGGQVQSMCDQVTSSIQYIKAGKLRALAVAAPSRLESLPDVPTFAEAGLPEMNSMAWYGIMAPGSTPKHIVERINLAMNKALKSPRIQKALAATGAVPVGGSQSDFDNVIAQDLKRVGAVVKTQNISLE